MRAFAKPAPRTMTKEWQEATNEFLKVGIPALRSPLLSTAANRGSLPTGTKVGPLDRYLVGGLLGQGPRAIPSGEEINHCCFPLSIDATFGTENDPCGTNLEWNWGGGGALEFLGADIRRCACKYCTAMTMRQPFLGGHILYRRAAGEPFCQILGETARERGSSLGFWFRRFLRHDRSKRASSDGTPRLDLDDHGLPRAMGIKKLTFELSDRARGSVKSSTTDIVAFSIVRDRELGCFDWHAVSEC